jgi:hypothetical protein
MPGLRMARRLLLEQGKDGNLRRKLEMGQTMFQLGLIGLIHLHMYVSITREFKFVVDRLPIM